MAKEGSSSGQPVGRPIARRRRTLLVSGGLLLVILALAYAAASLARPAASQVGPLGKVDPKVVDAVDARGETTFWAILREKANLSRAPSIQNDNARGAFVVNELKRVANESQGGLRGQLTKQGVAFQPFWIINAIKITGDEAVLKEVAAEPEVERIIADGAYRIPDPIQGKQEPAVDTVEWNIDRIRAPLVWSTFGDRGEGIVVANIDTGVQFDHPADVAQYRGNLGGGSFDHNYNWFDPSQICGSPSLVPCDNVGHGTHTMGTMVGDDGDPGTNQIGVAPHAKWIAAKGCESTSCSFSALLSSGQWVLAPTDLSGNNPRPDLRPNIVNNSWGGGPGDPFYQATVQAWIASGIFPQFSNGNAGPGCGSSGSPGDYLESYSAGAFDINNNIAGFSSRGPSAFGSELKPNIAAPGVNVRSSVPPSTYANFSGTSMASPHVAGTVALIWSAAPALVGDIPGTRALLDQTAIDTSDLTCGGSAADNNVWGEGRLDAFAAVDQSPRGPTGTLTGTVTDASTTNPVAGATVHAVSTDISPPVDRTTTTNASGQYTFTLPVGHYDVTASAFGYQSQTASGVEVTDGGTTTHDFALQPAPSHSVSGQVSDGDSNPLPNATVEILGTPIPSATTDANGNYTFPSVPEGEYDVRASQGKCFDSQTQHLVVDGDETLDFMLPRRHDNFGYFCQVVTPSYIEGDTPLTLSGDDASVQVSLPFAFAFYGQTYNTTFVCTNGHLTFLNPGGTFCPFFNSAIPSSGTPNAAIYPYWDDMLMDGSSTAWTKTIGVAPNRQFVIEWRNIGYFGDLGRRVDFEVVLYENGRILTQYRNIAADGREQGNSATIGIENAAGDDALQYSFNEAVIDSPEFAVLYRLPPNGFVQGHVTDTNDNQAVSGATVKAIQGGVTVRQTTTDANGFYRMQLFVGDYTVEASKTNYVTESAPVPIVEDQTTTQDFSLATARAEVSPTSLEFIVPPDQTRTKMLRLSNTGSADMTWEVRESGGGTATGHLSWLRRAPDRGVQMQKNAIRSGLAYPSAARWHPDTDSVLAPSILVYTDDFYHGSPNTYVDQALQRLGLSYTAFYDGNFGGFESALTGGGPWDVVVLADDNFIPPTSTLTALNNYVTGGGKLIVDSWTVGFNTSPLWTTVGFQRVADDNDPPDPMHWWQPDHPVFTDPESVPEFTQLQSGRYGIYGQRGDPLANFEALAGVTASATPGQAAMVLGNDNHTIFKGFTDGQNDADLDADGVRDGVELWENMVSGIEQGFFADVPWLSENPTSGTLVPGAHQDVQVTVDTTGLAPGVYDARLTFRTNSGRQPNVVVPVRLIVPAYQQAFNTGGGAYTSVSGDPWSADRAYTPANGSGYVQSSPKTTSTPSAIGGTLDDPLYQNARIGDHTYRFTGLAPGAYQLELKFAEIQNKNPGKRMFDVIVNGSPYLIAFDISSLVGKNFALDRSLFVHPVGGEISVQFATRRSTGEPILNAVRVTHRPDQ